MAIKNIGESAYYWKDIVSHCKLPSSAFRGGTDVDGSPIYVGRAKHEGDLLPGSIFVNKGIAHVTYAGWEYDKTQFQVLCCTEPCLEWIPSRAGEVPLGAVVAGNTNYGENLYIGRVHHKASQIVGKIAESHNVCYIPFDGKEVMYQHYEVLAFKGEV